jgi:S1-C subfamily serine protease
MSTGQSFTARLLGTDVQDDVAVLRLTGASGLRPVTTDSGGVTKGESITAVGDAGGATGYLSAVDGAVTALHRSITTHSEGGSGSERLHGLVQLAADVVSGDSGGAVLDSTGRVVGMTTAASSGPGAVTGYAIPISAVLGVVARVDTGTGSARVSIGYDAFLGIELPQGSATTVAGVIPGTPAARLGLADADTVTAVDGRRVPTATALRRAIAAHRPGDRVTVRWTDPAGIAHSGSVRLTRGPVA